MPLHTAAWRLYPPIPNSRACSAGQGGKQSAKDASGKFARSAGSRLRRYNEAALQRDVAGEQARSQTGLVC